jgi:hypothetical protein
MDLVILSLCREQPNRAGQERCVWHWCSASGATTQRVHTGLRSYAARQRKCPAKVVASGVAFGEWGCGTVLLHGASAQGCGVWRAPSGVNWTAARWCHDNMTGLLWWRETSVWWSSVFLVGLRNRTDYTNIGCISFWFYQTQIGFYFLYTEVLQHQINQTDYIEHTNCPALLVIRLPNILVVFYSKVHHFSSNFTGDTILLCYNLNAEALIGSQPL